MFQSPLCLFTKDESLLYSLNVFGAEELEQTDATASSTTTHASDQTDEDEHFEQADDIWDINLLPKAHTERVVIKSWDTFPTHPAAQWQPLSLSEAGRCGFDAALVHQATRSGLENSGRVAQTEPFLFSLFKLGLGWNSVFFRFNEQTKKFEKNIKDARISGISLPAMDSLIQEFLECGTYVRYIRHFIATAPSKVNHTSSLSGLCRAVFILLCSVEDQLFERFRAGLSLLELQETFRRCGCLMKCLLDIANSAANTNSDGDTVSNVFGKCDHYSQQFVWLSDILHELMTLVATPWLSLIAKWMGVETRSSDLDEVLGAGVMPDFVPPEHAGAIIESGRILRLLRKFHPSHPFVDRKLSSSTPASLSFEYAITWEDIDRIQSKAHTYEAKVRAEISKCAPSSICATVDKTPTAEDQDKQESIDDIYELCDLDMPDAPKYLAPGSHIPSQKLYKLLSASQCLNPSETLSVEAPFGPPLGVSIYLSFAPIISAQTRLINFSFLQVLFQKHKVRDHLQLQWRFQLLGDPTFISRLSLTLFDPDMKSGERKKGVARGGLSTGLRLGSRDTWPPATSELRLVLMGMLTECYDSEGQDWEGRPKASEKELPGGLSFSIRDLTDEEITNCKNPNALEALDFLRLQYNPSPLLSEIITAKSLRRYDRLFKHLLRLTRILSVVQYLVREITNRHSFPGTHSIIERRFRFEALHFIQSISDYAFSMCLTDTWRKFESTLSKIEQCIERGDIHGALEHAESPSRLREYHEDILGQMLFSLFLTKKHVHVAKQLEYIFNTILAYASLSKQEKTTSDSRYERAVYKLYSDFRKFVGGFMRFLRSMDGGKVTMSGGKHRDLAAWGHRQTATTEVNSVFEHLLLRLDMKEYY